MYNTVTEIWFMPPPPPPNPSVMRRKAGKGEEGGEKGGEDQIFCVSFFANVHLYKSPRY